MGPLPRTGWATYTSDRYELHVGHPEDWTVVPSARSWKAGIDAANHLSPAHEAFVSPSGAIRVSVWQTPFVTGTTMESTGDIEAWVQDYRVASGNTPCTGIHERAVELCLEAYDCHPGVLVPFRDDVQAFFTAGSYSGEAMTVVAVWSGETDFSVAEYGGAQRLLEAFLATMEVWPASTSVSERR